MGTRVKSPKTSIKTLAKIPKKGKGIAAGLILVLVVLVILLIATLAFPKLNSQPEKQVVYVAKRIPSKHAPKSHVAQAATPPTTTTDTVSAKVNLSNYRDPFKPLASATSTDTSANTVGQTGNTNPESSGGSTGSSSVDVLSLQSLTTQNGAKAAIVLYKGKQYTVETGDVINSSPFKVTDIGDNNISLLYGNSRLTLQVGDTIVK